MGEHHALGVAGGAGRVEDRRRRVGVEVPVALLDLLGVLVPVRRPAGDEVVPRDEAVAVRGLIGVEHHDGGDGVEGVAPALELVGALEDRHLRARLAGDEGHLLGGEGVVDRHRGRRRVHRAHVADQVLDPVGGHDRDGVADLHARPDERGGEVEGRLAGLRPGERAPGLALRDPVPVGVGRLVGVRRRGVGQRVDEGAAGDGLLDPRAVRGDVGVDGIGQHVGHAGLLGDVTGVTILTHARVRWLGLRSRRRCGRCRSRPEAGRRTARAPAGRRTAR